MASAAAAAAVENAKLAAQLLMEALEAMIAEGTLVIAHGVPICSFL